MIEIRIPRKLHPLATVVRKTIYHSFGIPLASDLSKNAGPIRGFFSKALGIYGEFLFPLTFRTELRKRATGQKPHRRADNLNTTIEGLELIGVGLITMFVDNGFPIFLQVFLARNLIVNGVMSITETETGQKFIKRVEDGVSAFKKSKAIGVIGVNY